MAFNRKLPPVTPKMRYLSNHTTMRLYFNLLEACPQDYMHRAIERGIYRLRSHCRIDAGALQIELLPGRVDHTAPEVALELNLLALNCCETDRH